MATQNEQAAKPKLGKIVYLLKYLWWAWQTASKSHEKYKANIAKGMSEVDALADALPEVEGVK